MIIIQEDSYSPGASDFELNTIWNSNINMLQKVMVLLDKQENLWKEKFGNSRYYG